MNLLLLSAGRQTYLVEEFKKNNVKVVVADTSKTVATSSFSDRFYVIPKFTSREYLNSITKIIEKENINTIITLHDYESVILSKNINSISTNIIFVGPSFETALKCFDKYETYLYLKENNIRTPKTYINLDKVLKDICDKSLQYPIFIKPRFGMGSKLNFKVNNKEELIFFYKYCKKYSQIDEFIKSNTRFSDSTVLLQEYIKGEEYGVDIINDLDYEYQFSVIKKKLLMMSGETTKAEMIHNDDITKITTQIAKTISFSGNLDCDIILSNENYYVIDMNPRFGGGYMFSSKAGIEVPFLIKQWIYDKDISDWKFYKKNQIFEKISNIIKIQ